jgi:predicted PurR-regulated permease PerM
MLFAALGVPYGMLLSVLAFVGEFIPVVGWWIAFVPIVLITMLSDNPYAVVWVISGISLLQLVQNYAIAPKLISDTMDIHPLTVVLAMLIGGALGGGVGLLLAVPVAAAAKAVLNQFFWKDNATAADS